VNLKEKLSLYFNYTNIINLNLALQLIGLPTSCIKINLWKAYGWEYYIANKNKLTKNTIFARMRGTRFLPPTAGCPRPEALSKRLSNFFLNAKIFLYLYKHYSAVCT
jgi:hypothetical protein